MSKPSKIYPTLYIGDLKDAENVDNLFDLGITHVLSVGAGVQDKDEDIKYLSLEVLDMEDQNILKHFEPAFKYIEKARNGGACLVHCNAGVSRSATICIAYIMKKFKLSLQDALETVSEVRPQICPNAGFMRQLEHYYETLHPGLKKKKAEEPVQQQPSAEETEKEKIAKVEETEPQAAPSDPIASQSTEESAEGANMQEIVTHKSVFSCRMCRKPLFFAEHIMPHQVAQHDFAHHKRDKGNLVSADLVTCNSHFLQEPLQWMGNVDDNEGKISCFKCQSRVGFWKWDGQQCSCGTWVTPAIQIAKNRVDERTLPVATLVPIE